MGSKMRVPGKEHIPNYPKGFIALRILQLIISIIVVGIIAYTMAVVPFLSNGLMLFTSLATLAITIWLVSAHSCAPRAYNYWATLVFDILLFLLWVISFILVAFSTAWLFVQDGTYCTYYNCYSYELSDEELAFAAVLAAAAGLGAVNALLFFISLIIHSVVVCRHRRAGLQSKPGRGAVTGHHPPYQMTPQTNTAYAAIPQQGIPYTQQQQSTEYNPHQMYNPPTQGTTGGYSYPPQSTSSPPPGGFYQQQQQQGFYAATPPTHPAQAAVSPISSQPTSDGISKNTSSPTVVHEVPDQSMYPSAPYQPPPYNPSYQKQ